MPAPSCTLCFNTRSYTYLYSFHHTWVPRYAEIYQTWLDLADATEKRGVKLAEAQAKQEKLEALWLDIANQAAPLMAFLNETKSTLTAPIIAEGEVR